jgi:SulP family sulfate permease
MIPVKKRIPAWMSEYPPSSARPDFVAGLTLAAYAIPVAIAYSSLAGLPGQAGLYCYLFGGLGYVFFGTSRQLAIGPTAAISMAVGAALASLAGDDASRAAALAALTALLVGIMGLVGWFLRLSQLVNFVSETVLLGFKAGAALSIAVTQLPKVFGVTGGGKGFFERVYQLCLQLGDTNPYVLLFGSAAILLLLAGDKLLPGRPVALLVVVASLVVMSLTGLEQHGVKVVGELPQGLPSIQLPGLGFSDVDDLLPLAFACLLLSYVESVSAARTFAAAHDYRVDPRRELLAMGMANVCAALGQGYPVAGGLSQSAVNDKAGARTPAAVIWASLAIGAVLLFLTGLFRNLPEAVLGAIVLVAVKGLIDLRELAHVWRVSRFDFNVAMAALIGVLFLGILKGILLAAIISILLLLRRASRPHVAFLGRIPGTDRFSDMERHPDNERIPGVLAFRVESAVLYFNAEHVEAQVLKHLEKEPVKLVVFDLSTSPYLDLAGARMLARLQAQLAARGSQLRFVNAHAVVRDLLRAEGLEERVGKIGRRSSVASMVAEFQKRNP